MSAHGTHKHLTAPDILARKGKVPIVVLAAYTAPIAKLIDPEVDVILVGDSLGMVLYGMESTLPVTLELIIAHGRAVAQASSHAMVWVDMPFGSYQGSPEAAFNAAASIMAQTGCAAVKLEGGAEMGPTIAFLTARGIPVVGHVGLKPQSVHAMGGYRYQGRSEAEAERILHDALAVQEGGAFAIVLEGVREDVARHITEKLAIPTIGIGASPACDGQVLVIDDMLGLTGHAPSFVKQYAHLGDDIRRAVKAYAEEVRSQAFPALEHCFRKK